DISSLQYCPKSESAFLPIHRYFFIICKCQGFLLLQLSLFLIFLQDLSATTADYQQRFEKTIFSSGNSNSYNYSISPTNNYNLRKQQQLRKAFQCFGKLDSTAAYSITLCADVPDNSSPLKPLKGDETGHVFVILTKRTASTSVSRSFGFYPKHMLFTVFVHRSKSKIADNGGRVYDIAITEKIDAQQFAQLLEYAIELSYLKYHLKKNNCYHYALALFNFVSEVKLKTKHIRLPFLFGKGGSPCGLYSELMKMKKNNPSAVEQIIHGSFTSPENSCR
ncbi:MAG TPA: hypothetical protein VK173_04380, partial [Lacibacter sp.]|nr:hypothetical protein [Lacibacter sp.]